MQPAKAALGKKATGLHNISAHVVGGEARVQLQSLSMAPR